MKSIIHKLLPPCIQFGPPRTGSTLVWNAMRYMCPFIEIPKRHDLNALLRLPFNPCRIVCTVRNPLDAVASFMRCYDLDVTMNELKARIIEFQRNGMNELPKLVRRNNVLILRYEDFYNDYDYLFDSLEEFLTLKAETRLRRRFKDDFSAVRVKFRSDLLGGFENFSKDDNIHGRHVSENMGEPGAYYEVLDDKSVTMIREAFSWHFEKFGY